MQLMPKTAALSGRRSVRPGAESSRGARYLSDLLRMFNGNLSLALPGYNAGENSVVKYGYQIRPYAETRMYVPKVLGFYL
jgi:soluble lytic murein transglycosylase-like protein